MTPPHIDIVIFGAELLDSEEIARRVQLVLGQEDRQWQKVLDAITILKSDVRRWWRRYWTFFFRERLYLVLANRAWMEWERKIWMFGLKSKWERSGK